MGSFAERDYDEGWIVEEMDPTPDPEIVASLAALLRTVAEEAGRIAFGMASRAIAMETVRALEKMRDHAETTNAARAAAIEVAKGGEDAE
jgi:hypothetical protein